MQRVGANTGVNIRVGKYEPRVPSVEKRALASPWLVSVFCDVIGRGNSKFLLIG